MLSVSREHHPNINVWMLKLHHLKINVVSVSEANTQGKKSKIFA